MDKELLYEKIKTARIQRFLTNCYSLDVIDHCVNTWEHGDDFIFSYEDHGIQRLIFFAKSWESVDQLLDKVEGDCFFLEFMTKDPNEYIPKNATLIAELKRLANPDCTSVFENDSLVLQYKDAAKFEIAREEDTKEINNILWTTFHTEISHLLYDKELCERIKNGQLTIHKNADNQIDAILQAEVMPKKFYINQIINKSTREIIHSILLYKLNEYIKANGKYLYAWVEKNNIPSLKFHQKYGMEHDGMWCMIYRLERK